MFYRLTAKEKKFLDIFKAPRVLGFAFVPDNQEVEYRGIAFDGQGNEVNGQHFFANTGEMLRALDAEMEETTPEGFNDFRI